ncbi:MAG: DUF1467 family protein [Hyphomonadaceae bacterium]
MNLLGVAFYLITWWMAFFLLLPIGVRNLDEAGVESARGADRGAPAQPRLVRKALWAAAIAAVVWIIGFTLMATGLFDIRDLE